MRSLLNLILEAPLDDATAKKMLDSGKQVSIYYQGDDNNPKGWRKVEPVRIEGSGDEKVMVAYEIPKETSKKPTLKKFNQKKIVNWNVLGTATATVAAKEKEKDKKAAGREAPPAPPKVKKRNLGSKGNDFCDAIINKRYVRMYYKGDAEEAPGWRVGVEPVAYGSRKGIRYIRAWIGAGSKSASADKNPDKKPPGWRFFREDRIQKWEVDATKTFTKPPASNFNPKGDKLMDTIFCISDFAPDKAPGASGGEEPLLESKLLPGILEAVKIF